MCQLKFLANRSEASLGGRTLTQKTIIFVETIDESEQWTGVGVIMRLPHATDAVIDARPRFAKQGAEGPGIRAKKTGMPRPRY